MGKTAPLAIMSIIQSGDKKHSRRLAVVTTKQKAPAQPAGAFCFGGHASCIFGGSFLS